MDASTLRLTLMLTAATLLSACGGGGSGSTLSALGSNTSATTGSGTTTTTDSSSTASTETRVVEGTIDGFGSVVIDGVHYDVEGADILHGEDTLREEDLEVGEVVRLIAQVGANDSAVASAVYRRRDLEGPVDAIDLAGNTLTILGRVVQVDPETRFSAAIVPNDLQGLALAQRVEVSGVALADGTLLATFVTLDNDNENALRGQISGADSASRTFTVNGTTVDYGNAVLDDDFAGAAPAVGDWVTVKSQSLPVSGLLEATEVDLDREGAGNDFHSVADVPEGATVILRGRVTSAPVSGQFEIEGREIHLASDTLYEGGTEADLDLDDGLVVEGTLESDGSVTASTLRFSTPMTFEVEGTVTSLTPLIVAGVEVALTTDTQLLDESSIGERFFNQADLQLGDFLEVRGNYNGAVLTARRIERDDEDNDDAGRIRISDDSNDDFRFDEADDDEWSIKGAITALNATEVAVRGLTARFAPGTRYEIGDVLVDQARFLAEVSVGDPAEMETLRLADGTLVVSEIEREFHRNSAFLDLSTSVSDDGTSGISDDSTSGVSDDSTSGSSDDSTSGSSDDSTSGVSDDLFEGAGDDGRFGEDDFDENEDDDGIEVKGPVSAFSTTGVTLGSVNYAFSSSTRYKAFDQRMTQSLFLSYLQVGTFIEIDYRTDTAGNRIVLKIKIDD